MLVRAMVVSLVVALAAMFSTSSVRAELSDVVVLFVKVDLNDDRVLSPAEVIAITMHFFNEVDGNHDGFIDKEELGDLAKDPEYLDNDDDHNGKLSVIEVIKEKLADFKVADTNSDGVLSLAEVEAFYKK
jgi:Ca2+-binding EF-hand superfamily protein